ncbi:ABC transporter substrate-binding protein [Rathayibacter sp. CAU 1779]
MIRKKRYLAVTVVTASALILTACSTAQPKSTSTASDDASNPVTVAGAFPIVSLNPYGQYAADSGTGLATKQYSDTLVVSDGKSGYTPHLAKSFTSSADGKTWTLKLRKAEFSDGSDFTSADVKESADLMVAGGGPLAPTFKAMTIDTPDAHTVTITSATGGSGVLSFFQQLPISPAKEVNDPSFFDKPVGIGPFEVSSFTSNSELDLVPNPHYWGTAAKAKSVKIKTITDISARITALQNNEVQAIWGIPDDQFKPLTSDDTLTTKIEPSTNQFIMWMNAKQEGLSKLKVRQAIWKAIDFGAIQKSLYPYSAIGAKAPVSQAVPGAGQFSPYKYDPKAAKKLLAEAGYPDGLTVELQYDSTHPDYADLIAAMKSDLAKVGINLTVDSKEHAVWLKDFLALNFGINVQSTGPGTGDPMSWLARLYTCAANRTGYCSPDLDKILLAGDAAVDAKTRQADFLKAQQYIWDNAIGMFPLDLAVTYAWSSKLHGLTADATYMPSLATVTVSK